jgi:hypothetical protein
MAPVRDGHGHDHIDEKQPNDEGTRAAQRKAELKPGH